MVCYRLIIQKNRIRFKCNISIDNAGSSTYRTIVSQASQTQRLIAPGFFEKNLPNRLLPADFLLPEEKGVDGNGNGIVEGMGAGGDSEPANCKQNRKINTRNCPEAKLRQVKGTA